MIKIILYVFDNMNIYNTFEPYNDDSIIVELDCENKLENVNECLICLENTNKKIIIQLNDIKTYFKKCKCNAYVHLDCFNKWINIKSVCPICRNKIKKNKNDKYLNRNLTQSDIRKYEFLNYFVFFCQLLLGCYLMLININSVSEMHNKSHNHNASIILNDTHNYIIYNFNHSNYHN